MTRNHAGIWRNQQVFLYKFNKRSNLINNQTNSYRRLIGSALKWASLKYDGHAYKYKIGFRWQYLLLFIEGE